MFPTAKGDVRDLPKSIEYELRNDRLILSHAESIIWIVKNHDLKEPKWKFEVIAYAKSIITLAEEIQSA